MPSGKRIMSLKQVKTQAASKIEEKPMDKELFIAEFEKFLLYEKRYSTHNVRNILQRVRRIVYDYNVIKPCQDDAIIVEERQRSKGNNNKTISHFLNALELLAEYHGDVLKLRRPKQTVRQPEFLNIIEARALLQATANKRDKATIAVLLYCGLRNKELCALDVEDVDLTNRVLWIRDRGQGIKNRHERKTVLSQDCADTLKEWLSVRPQIDGNNALFITVYGDRITCDRLERIVRETGKTAGIEKRVYPHMLRHSCASNMLKTGIPITEVMLQLGHRSLSSTMIYLHGNVEGLKESIDKNFTY